MKRLLAAFAICLAAAPAHAKDPLLEETVSFTGEIFQIQTGVPGLLVAAVRGDESAVFGFGEIAKGTGKAPDGETRVGVGSLTKTFTGLTLAHLVTDGVVPFTAEAGDFIALVDAFPQRDGRAVRLIDLATQSGGFGRELEPVDGAAKYSDASFAGNLGPDALLYAPGTGIIYSNVGFDLLAMALSGATGKPYAALLQDTVLSPLGLAATGYDRPKGDNVMVGHDWNGNPMDPGEPIPNRAGASSLYTTANDMVRYLKWQLAVGGDDAEARLVSHAAYLIRDGLEPVYGMDESGHMDAMALGWVIMMPEGDRPLIIQKAGGADGVFSYTAFAPSRGVGVFIAINEFDFAAGMEMATVTNALIAALAPR
ncbi:MAG: D-alanyl-D-alanine-carboxypeptidase/ endopeptidase AmpH [Acuticoccus sp.]